MRGLKNIHLFSSVNLRNNNRWKFVLLRVLLRTTRDGFEGLLRRGGGGGGTNIYMNFVDRKYLLLSIHLGKRLLLITKNRHLKSLIFFSAFFMCGKIEEFGVINILPGI